MEFVRHRKAPLAWVQWRKRLRVFSSYLRYLPDAFFSGWVVLVVRVPAWVIAQRRAVAVGSFVAAVSWRGAAWAQAIPFKDSNADWLGIFWYSPSPRLNKLNTWLLTKSGHSQRRVNKHGGSVARYKSAEHCAPPKYEKLPPFPRVTTGLHKICENLVLLPNNFASEALKKHAAVGVALKFEDACDQSKHFPGRPCDHAAEVAKNPDDLLGCLLLALPMPRFGQVVFRTPNRFHPNFNHERYFRACSSPLSQMIPLLKPKDFPSSNDKIGALDAALKNASS